MASARAQLRGVGVKILVASGDFILFAARPVNALLRRYYASRAVPGSVLHISAMVHIPWLTVEALKRHGVRAAYMATTTSSVWNQADYHVEYSRWPPVRAFQQLRWFWGTVARYEIIHSHFMMTLTPTGWELPLLKSMGRGLVVNFRGCDIRDRDLNRELHPDVNICDECDYWIEERGMYACQQPEIERQRQWARDFGDLILVTTPDMKDFWPDAVHVPFFAPDVPKVDANHASRQSKDGVFKIVHATNHPGIEGTRQIQEAVNSLAAKGYPIEFCFLKGVGYQRVLEEMRDADLSIGKMKMGYYANAQIESMMHGVPTVTYIRDEFITPELRESGFILSSLSDLERTLEYYLDHPEELARKRSIARTSIQRLHDNDVIAERLKSLYAEVSSGLRG